MSRVVLGIDVGLGGAIALLQGDEARVWDMPTLTRLVNRKRKRRVHVEALAALVNTIAKIGEVRIAFVEMAQASDQMGVSSAFSFGETYGIIQGALAYANATTRLVQPRKWKMAMGLTTPGHRDLGRNDARDKTPALELARKLYPQLANDLALQKHEGRAEALLIAHYGCEVLDEEAAAA